MQISDSIGREKRRDSDVRGLWRSLLTIMTRRQSVGMSVAAVACLLLLLLLLFAVVATLASSSSSSSSSSSNDSRHCETSNFQDPFVNVPFCDADGTCHEQPDQPSPRTLYSAFTAHQYATWYHFQSTLAATAAAFEILDQQQQPERPLVLLGDSITESWLGTGMGQGRTRTAGVPQVLQEWMTRSSHAWKPLVLAISGDQTQHLQWRLQRGGELTPNVAHDGQALFVVLIGTNNLGAGERPEPTARGILAVVDYLQQHVKGQILLLHVLPRGDGPTWLRDMCPPLCDANGKSLTSFLPAIAKVNAAVQQGIQKRYDATPVLKSQLFMLDCGDAFLQTIPAGEQVDSTLMPDRLHPNAAGHKLLAECIEAWIQEHIKV